MKRTIRNILIAVAAVAAVVTLTVLRQNATLRGLEVVVKSSGKNALLSPAELDSIIHAAYPYLETLKIKEVNRKEVRELVGGIPCVKNAEVSVTTGGKLLVAAQLREPVIRMFYQGNEFYLSHEGTCMPLTASHYCHIVVGSSDWKEPTVMRISQINLADTTAEENPEGLRKLWTLACFLYDHPQYGGVFDQLHLTESGDLVMVQKLGNTLVVVGNEEGLEDKFANLWTMYDQGVSQVGWDAYSEISLKYKGQVVCTRKK